MNLKQELQKLSQRLDKTRDKLASAEARGESELAAHRANELETINKKIAKLKDQQAYQVKGTGEGVKALAFNRPITKAEQADMGKLKKSVRGLVVVHPLTKLGREMGVEVVTGYAPAVF